MDLKLEALIVGLFAVLPGFLSAAVRATIGARARSSTGEWVAGSVVASLVLNAMAVTVFMAGVVVDFDLSQPVGQLGEPLGKLETRLVLFYLGALYLLALIWGATSGLAIDYAPRVLAHRLRLTPVSPAPNVFNDTLEKLTGTAENEKLLGEPAHRVPWLQVRRKDVVLLGRLRRGSVDFGVDAPVEIFLAPAFRMGDAGPVAWEDPPGADRHGVYLRLLPSDLVEVLTARVDWTPRPGAARGGSKAAAPVAETPALE